jgi:hypothetical protein
MSKIDLICDYLDSIGEVTFAHQGFAGVERLNEALAAARALKALKPVLWKHSGDGWSYEKPLFPATPLYALDEVTK